MKVLKFFRSNIVLTVSMVLALCSMFFVVPSADYLDYIDFRTLALLFSLMCVVGGLNGQGIFRRLALLLVGRSGNTRKVSLMLILLCFFSSMLITNDVALITFVPFTVMTFTMCNCKKDIVLLVTLETVAANLGSMATPVGNPQNLYLYNFFTMEMGEFLFAVLPYAALSLVLLLVSVFMIRSQSMVLPDMEIGKSNKIKVAVYVALFVLTLLCVLRLIPAWVVFAVTLAVSLILDVKVVLKVDYSLLLTFVFLFVFIGNLGNIKVVYDFLQSVVKGNELLVGVLASQVFSNVPTAVLLSGFTTNASALLTAVNLGGLGTVIASMASLISLNAVGSQVNKARYLGVFTAVNVVFLLANILLYLIISREVLYESFPG